jgi:TetR/AcrR family transcriptional repressor of mexCD-oprJ operon
VWFVTRSTAIHDRVAGAILDAAADLIADGGEPPSMNEVAEAAGVARATLYRYFPTRERLLQDLTATAIDVTATRLAEADLDAVPVAEGIARIARVVAASGSKYAALVSQFGRGNISLEEQNRIKPMIDALLHRGIDDETFRGDITADELGFLFGSLLEAAARMAAEHQAGAEKAAALVTSVFLHGTERRKEDGLASPA